jgi:hypothetical protein
LSIGIQHPAAIQVIDRLRETLVQSIEWRQRLPPRSDGESREEWTNVRDETARRLRQSLRNVIEEEHLLQSLLDRLSGRQ